MTHRRGLTLVEVLVAIFVMGLGLLALLVLFPLGALSMAESIKDNRMGQIATIALGLARARDLTKDSLVLAAMTNPPTSAPTIPSGGPSYPIYVDPYGYRLQSAGNYFVGTNSTSPATNIRRVTPAFLTPDPVPDPPFAGFPVPDPVAQWFTLRDDMAFGDNGTPLPSGIQQIQRSGRYTWAYMCQELQWVGPGSSSTPHVNVTVVAYDRRPLAAGTNGQLIGENTYQATFDSLSRVVKVNWTAGQDPPAIRPGGWILDASSNPIQGAFYRVVGVTQTGPTSMDLELQTRPQASSAGPGTGVLVVLEGVSEVFPMGLN